MASVDDELRARVRAWIDEDPDTATREELERLVKDARWDELAERFGATLQFGTAGLRGILGGGPNRMNSAVVARATAGLCAYLLAEVPDAAKRGVCIGFDGRRMSREFAADVAAIVTGAGLVAHVFESVAPTPLTAFGVLATGAAAGVMVTASHNPPEYNGYKVYWGNGAQIIPPHDVGIAEAIARVGPLATIARQSAEAASAAGLLRRLGPDVERGYLDGVRALAVHPETPRDLGVAYTALHGVGDRLARAALGEAGFERVWSVPEQAEPDPRFPTVAFPNPEEKGAMDLVLALGRAKQADIVVANDPDADRLAVAVRAPSGDFVQLSGNELGCLLGHYLLDQGKAAANKLVIASIVSSPMLGAIARAHGTRFEQTLTGFKWIANRAMDLEEEEGATFVFGYEEALGYTVGSLVRDKDGIGAAAVTADMAAWCKSRGKTLLDELEEAWRRYGLFLSKQVSVTMPGLEGASQIARIMEKVRRAPPKRLGAYDVLALADLELGTRAVLGAATEASDVLSLPRASLILLEIAGGHRVMLRPSGTEPKIKYYFDVRVELASGEPLADGRARGERVVEELVAAFREIVAVA